MRFFKKFMRKGEKQNQTKQRELFLRLQKIAVNEFKLENTDKIGLKTRFKEDLGIDSLSSIELLMKLEEAFGLEIPDEAAEKFLTVEDVINYLENKV